MVGDSTVVVKQALHSFIGQHPQGNNGAVSNLNCYLYHTSTVLVTQTATMTTWPHKQPPGQPRYLGNNSSKQLLVLLNIQTISMFF